MYQAIVTFSITLPTGFKALASSRLTTTTKGELLKQVEDFKEGFVVEQVSYLNH